MMNDKTTDFNTSSWDVSSLSKFSFSAKTYFIRNLARDEVVGAYKISIHKNI